MSYQSLLQLVVLVAESLHSVDYSYKKPLLTTWLEHICIPLQAKRQQLRYLNHLNGKEESLKVWDSPNKAHP